MTLNTWAWWHEPGWHIVPYRYCKTMIDWMDAGNDYTPIRWRDNKDTP